MKPTLDMHFMNVDIALSRNNMSVLNCSCRSARRAVADQREDSHTCITIARKVCFGLWIMFCTEITEINLSAFVYRLLFNRQDWKSMRPGQLKRNLHGTACRQMQINKLLQSLYKTLSVAHNLYMLPILITSNCLSANSQN